MNLQNGEFVLFKINEEINIEIYGSQKTYIQDLYLTNKSIIYDLIVTRHAFKKNETREERIKLSDINILNGAPQIFIDDIKNNNEELGWKLQIFLKNGGVTFLFDEYASIKDLDKEKNAFINEIYKVLVGRQYSTNELNDERAISATQAGVKRGAAIGKNVAEAVKVVPFVGNIASRVLGVGTGLVGGAIGGIAGAVTGIKNKNKTNNSAQNIDYVNSVGGMNNTLQQKKCLGCHASISGYPGEKIVCLYCDTEQII